MFFEDSSSFFYTFPHHELMVALQSMYQSHFVLYEDESIFKPFDSIPTTTNGNTNGNTTTTIPTNGTTIPIPTTTTTNGIPTNGTTTIPTTNGTTTTTTIPTNGIPTTTTNGTTSFYLHYYTILPFVYMQNQPFTSIHYSDYKNSLSQWFSFLQDYVLCLSTFWSMEYQTTVFKREASFMETDQYNQDICHQSCSSYSPLQDMDIPITLYHHFHLQQQSSCFPSEDFYTFLYHCLSHYDTFLKKTLIDYQQNNLSVSCLQQFYCLLSLLSVLDSLLSMYLKEIPSVEIKESSDSSFFETPCEGGTIKRNPNVDLYDLYHKILTTVKEYFTLLNYIPFPVSSILKYILTMYSYASKIYQEQMKPLYLNLYSILEESARDPHLLFASSTYSKEKKSGSDFTNSQLSYISTTEEEEGPQQESTPKKYVVYPKSEHLSLLDLSFYYCLVYFPWECLTEKWTIMEDSSSEHESSVDRERSIEKEETLLPSSLLYHMKCLLYYSTPRLTLLYGVLDYYYTHCPSIYIQWIELLMNQNPFLNSFPFSVGTENEQDSEEDDFSIQWKDSPLLMNTNSLSSLPSTSSHHSEKSLSIHNGQKNNQLVMVSTSTKLSQSSVHSSTIPTTLSFSTPLNPSLLEYIKQYSDCLYWYQFPISRSVLYYHLLDVFVHQLDGITDKTKKEPTEILQSLYSSVVPLLFKLFEQSSSILILLEPLFMIHTLLTFVKPQEGLPLKEESEINDLYQEWSQLNVRETRSFLLLCFYLLHHQYLLTLMIISRYCEESLFYSFFLDYEDYYQAAVKYFIFFDLYS